MALSPALSGASAAGNYGFEATYGTVSASLNKSFGHGVKFSNLQRTNSVEVIPTVAYVEPQKLAPKLFGGSVTVEHVLSNGWWWKILTGNTAYDAGSGPYTHCFVDINDGDGSNHDPLTIANSEIPFSIDTGVNLTGTALEEILLGCIINQTEISSSKNDVIHCRHDVLFGNVTESTTYPTQVLDTWADPLVFGEATIKLAGTSISDIQNFTATINRNVELVYASNSRIATNFLCKAVDYTIKIGAYLEASTYITDLYGSSSGPLSTSLPAELASLEIVASNGLGTTSLRKQDLIFTGLQLDSLGTTYDAGAGIVQDMTFKARSLTFVKTTDNTATSL
jgi:hypothetical protein